MRKGLISITLFICFCAYPLVLLADDYYIQWIETIDNGGDDHAYSVATDFIGNIIVSGASVIDGDFDYLIVKYSPDGSVIWIDTTDNGSNDWPYAVTVDNFDNIIATGASAIGGNLDYYTIKYDPSSTALWSDTRNNGGHDYGRGVAVGNNRIYVTGYATIGGDYDYYTVVLNANGGFLGTRTQDNGDDDWAMAVASDVSDNFIVTGYSCIGGGDRDWYTVKYNSVGTVLWADTIGSNGEDYARDIAVDYSNNIVVTGSVDDDDYTVKYDPNGSILWADTLGGSFTPRSVAIDIDNNIVVTGTSNNDFFTVKYDSNGVVLWTGTLDIQGQDYAQGVAIDYFRNIIVTGYSTVAENFVTVKYAPLASDSMVATPGTDSLNANGADSTKVTAAVFLGGSKISSISDLMNFEATLGSFYGDVIEDTDTTYYQWYRAGTTFGEDIIWVYAGSVDSAMARIYLIDSDNPVIVWWDSLPDDTTSIPEDTVFGPYSVQAEMYDITSDIAQAWLYWNEDSVEMNPVSGDTFMAEIPQQIVLLGDSLAIDYYIKAWDASPSANLTQTEVRTFTIHHYDVGVEENVSIPQMYALGQNVPNPFSRKSTVTYQLPIQAHVSLVIYNALGQCVCTLVNGKQQPGYYSTSWDGQDDIGNRVANGIYFYRLQAGNFISQKKMLLVR